MMIWKTIDLPSSLLGAEIVSGSKGFKHRQTEILLPRKSPYEGYKFLHPSQLVSHIPEKRMLRLTYNDSFKFVLIKHDREPGRRYKRYTLDVPAFLDIYQPLEDKLKAQEEKRAEKRAKEKGTVILFRFSSGPHVNIVFAFANGKEIYSSNSIPLPIRSPEQILSVVAEQVPRSVFEREAKSLPEFEERLKTVALVQEALHRASDLTPVKELFLALCDRILKDVASEVRIYFVE